MATSLREEARAVRRTLRAVDDESQRDEMNAAIRAQRERGAVPRSMLPPEDELPERPAPPSEPPAPARARAAEARPARPPVRALAPYPESARGVYPVSYGRRHARIRRAALEAGAADRSRLRRRAHRRLRGRLRRRRAVLLVLVQPRRPRGARCGAGEHHPRERRHASRTARRERQPPARLDPADQPRAAEGDRRHRGPPLLLEQRDRLHRDRPRAEERRLVRRVRAGRLDDRAAAGAQPLPHSHPVARPQAHRRLPRGPARQAVEQEPHPHRLPQRHLLRPGGIRDRGGRRGVLRRARQGSLAGAGGAPRRAAAGAVGVRPAQPAGGCEDTPDGGPTGDARRRATSPARAIDGRFTARSACIRDRRRGSRARRT